MTGPSAFFSCRRAALVFAATLLCGGPPAARAQQPPAPAGWPERPIRMVVPFTAGGAIDVVARVLAQSLGEALGTTVVVDNKPGANGFIGDSIVAKAAPDGYTMLMNTGAFNGTALLTKNISYDSAKDFAPVTQVARSYGMVLILNSEVPAHNLKDFIALAKAKPEAMNYASGGEGNITHLGGELFNHLAGTKVQHVPYKGSGPAMQAVIAKEVTMTFVPTSLGDSPIRNRQVQALAVASPNRAPSQPEVPTFDELGLAGMDRLVGWYGVWLPAGTPMAIVDRVRGAIAGVLRRPDMQARFETLGLIGVASTPADFRKFVAQDLEAQRELLKLGNIQPQ
jgi:tripartite-type tricarboxylate transporter receptor subunit TctC